MVPNVGGQSWSPTESGSPHPASLSSSMTPSTVSPHSDWWWKAWLDERCYRADRRVWLPGLGGCCSRVGMVGHHEAQRQERGSADLGTLAAPTDLLTLGVSPEWIRPSHVGSLAQTHTGQWVSSSVTMKASGICMAGGCQLWLLTLPTWADAPLCPCLWGLISGAGATVVQDRTGHARIVGQTQMLWGD